MYKPEKFWDRMAGQFDKRAANFDITTSRTVEKAKKYLNADDVLLDYGCATGTFAFEFAGMVKKIYAIDFSSKMIAIAKRKAGERNIGNVDFTQTVIFDDQFKPGSFDVIFASDILHLVDDAGKVIQRINELLKPGGMLVSVTACMGETMAFIKIIMSLLIKIGLIPHIRFFKNAEIENLISNGNFQIVEIESLNKSNTQYFIAGKKK